MTDINMNRYTGTTFLKVADLGNGPRQEVIVRIEPGTKFDRPDATFESGDVLSLNRTNVKTLIEAYGENSRDWLGCTIELYVGQTEFNGEKRDSILVRPISPPRPFKERTPPPPLPKQGMDDEIPF